MDEYTNPQERVSSDEDYAEMFGPADPYVSGEEELIFEAARCYQVYHQMAKDYVYGEEVSEELLEEIKETWFGYPDEVREQAMAIFEREQPF